MNRALRTVSGILAGGVAVAALATVCLVAAPAAAQVVIVAPPAEVIATLTPVYHEGHAAYWYNGYWHYRDHGAWAYYHTEPGYLHDWRFAHPHYYHHYR
jgi:hypothetical protein